MEKTQSKNRILIVDDEPKMVRLLQKVFCSTGFEVLTAATGENAVQIAALEQPSLIVLDILLSGPVDGYEACRQIREYSDVPIIMLTAKVRDADRLLGFEVGADDYVTKPFNTRELIARVRAVLKRSSAGAPSQADPEIYCGSLHIHLPTHRVTVNGKEIHLTPKEYHLLQELARHPNQVLLHEQILTAVWGEEYRDDVEYLRAYIHTLRRKIETDPGHPKLIVRCPGVGYMLETAEEKEPVK